MTTDFLATRAGRRPTFGESKERAVQHGRDELMPLPRAGGNFERISGDLKTYD